MAELELQARPRTVVGKHLRRLRAAGHVPANVFGPGQPSLAIEIDARELRRALAHFGSTTLVRLRVAGEETPRRVLVRGMSRRPTTQEILHLDFYQVPLGARVRLAIALQFVGEAPAAHTTEGTVVRHLDTVEVEGVPGEVPETLPVDLARLLTADDAIFVRDLPVPAGASVLTPGDVLVVKVVPGRVHAVEAGEEPAAGKGAEPPARGD